MRIVGIERLEFGVENIPEAARFFRDFGLVESAASTAAVQRFETLEGAEIVLRSTADATLPPAVVPGSTIRKMVWGVESNADLDAIATELGRDRDVRREANGSVHSTDPNGYGIAFAVTRRRSLPPVDAAVNFPGRPVRKNTPVDFKRRPVVRHLGHVVVFSPEIEPAERFYRERLQFRISDRYPGRGTFLRASGAHDHHNLFLIKRDNLKGLHHASFEVTEFNDVMLTGAHMTKQGWPTQVGPGRHTLGSNYFWYFNAPIGGSVEVYSDMDYLTDEWQARDHEYKPEIIAAWSVSYAAHP